MNKVRPVSENNNNAPNAPVDRNIQVPSHGNEHNQRVQQINAYDNINQNASNNESDLKKQDPSLYFSNNERRNAYLLLQHNHNADVLYPTTPTASN